MIPERPVLVHRRETDSASLVLSCHQILCWTIKDIHVDAASDGTPGKIRRQHEGFHSVRVAEIYTVAPRLIISIRAYVLSGDKRSLTSRTVDLVVSCIEVEWMVAIYLMQQQKS